MSIMTDKERDIWLAVFLATFQNGSTPAGPLRAVKQSAETAFEAIKELRAAANLLRSYD